MSRLNHYSLKKFLKEVRESFSSTKYFYFQDISKNISNNPKLFSKLDSKDKTEDNGWNDQRTELNEIVGTFDLY